MKSKIQNVCVNQLWLFVYKSQSFLLVGWRRKLYFDKVVGRFFQILDDLHYALANGFAGHEAVGGAALGDAPFKGALANLNRVVDDCSDHPLYASANKHQVNLKFTYANALFQRTSLRQEVHPPIFCSH